MRSHLSDYKCFFNDTLTTRNKYVSINGYFSFGIIALGIWLSCLAGVDIEWEHGDEAKNKAGAKEMVNGFGLAVPPKNAFAPSMSSNNINGKAIDMDIAWKGAIKVNKKDGSEVSIRLNKA